MARRKTIFVSTALFVVVAFALGLFLYERVTRFKDMVDEAFVLNNLRKSEGYYTAEFEFKMLGIVYLFDRGHYLDSYRRFNHLYDQLKTADGLVRIPQFTSVDEELAFYLGLQDPTTGAFIDPSFPLPTYFGPTMNVIEHVRNLAESVGQPVTLRYPLTFLALLDEPDELRAFLDDLSMVGTLASKLPETPYILSNLDSYRELEAWGLFTFSDAWKAALARSLWETQDPETGFWGVRLRSNGQLIDGGDVNVTYKNIKELRDDNGVDRYDAYPLRYTDSLIDKLLTLLRVYVPTDRSEQHKSSINQYLTVKLLFNKLWSDLSPDQKQTARQQIAAILDTVFARFYVPSDGAFNLYADAETADLDGTQTYVGFLQVLGFFSAQRRHDLWGAPEDTIRERQPSIVAAITVPDLLRFDDASEINSIRFYREIPEADGYVSQALSFYYPNSSKVPDTLELTGKLMNWVGNTSQSMGNWASREALMARLENNDIVATGLASGERALAEANMTLKEHGHIIAIGFDRLQIPRQMIIFELERASRPRD